jgi:large subunit ribosomal protein L30
MAAEKKKSQSGTITVQYYRSAIGFDFRQKAIVKGLGLTKLNSTRKLIDSEATRGMVAKVPHLVRIIEG